MKISSNYQIYSIRTVNKNQNPNCAAVPRVSFASKPPAVKPGKLDKAFGFVFRILNSLAKGALDGFSSFGKSGGSFI